MKNLLAITMVALFITKTDAQKPVKLHRYFNASTSGHFFTTSWSELGNGNSAYKYEGVAGMFTPIPAPELHPFTVTSTTAQKHISLP